RTQELNVALGHLPLLSWPAVFAGLFVALLAAAIWLTLGLGIGGLSLESAIVNRSSAGGFTIGSGVWLILTGIFALFIGAYYAARVSNFITGKVGAAHGLVIAALFFGLFFIQLGLG